MAGGTYKFIDLVGTSPKSIEDAIQSAIAQATKSVRQIAWFEVTETRGRVEKGGVAEYQVSLRVGFKLE